LPKCRAVPIDRPKRHLRPEDGARHCALRTWHIIPCGLLPLPFLSGSSTPQRTRVTSLAPRSEAMVAVARTTGRTNLVQSALTADLEAMVDRRYAQSAND
jgi:hypothetical protein